MTVWNLLAVFLYVVSVSGQIPAGSQCQPSTCAAAMVSCSTNPDCECLALSSGGGGLCAALLSCSSLTPCSSDNQTCTVPYTVCVVKTRCNKPVCYPLALAVSQVCPPRNPSPTVSTVPTTAASKATTRTTIATTKAPMPTTTCLSWNQNPVIVAGNGTLGNSTSLLNRPLDLSIDRDSNVYVSDGYNERIIKFTNGSSVGVPLTYGTISGIFSHASSPAASVIDSYGNMYVSGMTSGMVIKYANISYTSASPPITGKVIVGLRSSYNYNQQFVGWGVAVDDSGNVFVSNQLQNRVMKWTPEATSGIVAAGIGNGTGGNGSSQLACPLGIALDQSLSLYIADAYNGRIQKWLSGSSAGITVAGGNGQLSYPTDVAVDMHGTIYALSSDGLYRFYPGSTWGTIVISSNAVAFGFKFDAVGNVYVADYGSNKIVKYTVNSRSCGSRTAKLAIASPKALSTSYLDAKAIVEAAAANRRLR